MTWRKTFMCSVRCLTDKPLKLCIKTHDIVTSTQTLEYFLQFFFFFSLRQWFVCIARVFCWQKKSDICWWRAYAKQPYFFSCSSSSSLKEKLHGCSFIFIVHSLSPNFLHLLFLSPFPVFGFGLPITNCLCEKVLFVSSLFKALTLNLPSFKTPSEWNGGFFFVIQIKLLQNVCICFCCFV